jgi:ABC-type nitrate/sulfonate/bicarbonate transport system ATPase subunit
VRVLIDGVAVVGPSGCGKSTLLGLVSHWLLVGLERLCIPWRAEP